MFAFHKNGKIDNDLPGDFDRALKDRAWYCTKCHDLAHTKSDDIIYSYQSDFVYHWHEDGRLYPCAEFLGFDEDGKSEWKSHVGKALIGKPLKINEKEVKIPKDKDMPFEIEL